MEGDRRTITSSFNRNNLLACDSFSIASRLFLWTNAKEQLQQRRNDRIASSLHYGCRWVYEIAYAIATTLMVSLNNCFGFLVQSDAFRSACGTAVPWCFLVPVFTGGSQDGFNRVSRRVWRDWLVCLQGSCCDVAGTNTKRYLPEKVEVSSENNFYFHGLLQEFLCVTKDFGHAR